jgi:hypothetical protein
VPQTAGVNAVTNRTGARIGNSLDEKYLDIKIIG